MSGSRSDNSRGDQEIRGNSPPEATSAQLAALSAAADAFALAGDRFGQAQTNFEIAMLQYAHRIGDCGLSHYRDAAAGFRLTGHAGNEAMALVGYCDAHAVLELPEEQRLADLDRAAFALRITGRPQTAAMADANYVYILTRLRRWDDVPRARRVLTVAVDDGSEQIRWRRLVALRYLVPALLNQGDHAGVLDVAPEAIRLADQLGEHGLKIRLMLFWATSLRQLGQHAQAADRYEQAITLIRRWGDTGTSGTGEIEATAIEDLGEALSHDPTAGVARLRRLADSYAASGNVLMEAHCRTQLAACLERAPRDGDDADLWGRCRDCAQQYEQAARLFGLAGEPAREAYCHLGAVEAFNWIPAHDTAFREQRYALALAAADRYHRLGDWHGQPWPSSWPRAG